MCFADNIHDMSCGWQTIAGNCYPCSCHSNRKVFKSRQNEEREMVRRWHWAVTHSMPKLLRPEMHSHQVKTSMWQEPRCWYVRPNAVYGKNESRTQAKVNGPLLQKTFPHCYKKRFCIACVQSCITTQKIWSLKTENELALHQAIIRIIRLMRGTDKLSCTELRQ